jgi:pimeloyl-ACP methyl ester carboxylesterase
VGGFRLSYDRAGSGPPVVALHGWPGSRRDYREVAARLGGEVDLVVPTTVLWPTEDPLFPVAWSDRIDAFLAHARLRVLDGVGHFVPLQAPDEVAGAIRAATGTSA